MSPPPPSLGAMVERGARRPKPKRPEPAVSSPWVWVVLALITAALTAYFMR